MNTNKVLLIEIESQKILIKIKQHLLPFNIFKSIFYAFVSIER